MSLDPAASAGERSVSVILPVRNEEETIGACLESVLRQDYADGPIEIIVADGCSSDRTREVVAAIQGLDPRVRLVDNPGRIVPTGMNAAIREARGHFIVRVDGHSTIGPEYVRRVVECFDRTGADCVGGRMEARGQGFWGRVIALATSHPFGVGGARFHYSQREGEADTVYLGAYRRSTLHEIGMYDERFVRNQDDELNYRLRAAGGTVWFDPKISSAYTNRSSLARLFRQYRQYGFWKVRLYRKHPGLFQPRHGVPACFVGVWAAGSLLGLLLPTLGLAFMVGLPAVHMAAGLAGSLAARWPAAEALGAPPAFFTMHVAYGLGFWQGILDALFRRKAFIP